MAQASGVYKQVSYKVATVAGIAAAGAGGKLLRRVTSSVDLKKDSYESAEMRSDFQRASHGEGVRRVPAMVSGELSPATYADFFAAFLKRDFAAVAAITSLSITISGAGPSYTVARASGSWLTSGLKIGMVFRFTAGTFTASNSNKNIVVAAMTALNLTVYVLNGSGLVAEGPIASATVTPTGKSTYTPQTGHIEKFFSIEEWFPEVPHSSTGYDLRVSSVAVNLPPTGNATVQFDLMGKDVAESATQRFTSPTAVTTTDVTAAVNGVMLFEGASVAVVTGLTINGTSAYTGEPVVGSNVIPALSPGRVIVKGSATVKFTDTVFRDAYRNGTDVDLAVVLTSSNAAAADFLAFIMSRIRLTDASRDDGEKEIIQTVPFEALLDTAGGASAATELTTLLIQDSAA